MFLDHENDAVSIAPEVHKVVLENDSIRVLDVIVPPGYKALSHWHPKNNCYVIDGGKLHFTLPDGTAKDAELVKDQVTQGEGEHIVENIGDTTVRVIQIEFKK